MEGRVVSAFKKNPSDFKKLQGVFGNVNSLNFCGPLSNNSLLKLCPEVNFQQSHAGQFRWKLLLCRTTPLGSNWPRPSYVR